MNQYLQLIFALIGVIGLILLFWWALKKYNKNIAFYGGKRLKVIDRASLGGEKSVVVVSIVGKLMVLGVTSARIEKIQELDITEEEYLEMLYPEDRGNDGFFTAFTEALSKNIRGVSAGKMRNRYDEAKDEQKEANDNDDVK